MLASYSQDSPNQAPILARLYLRQEIKQAFSVVVVDFVVLHIFMSNYLKKFMDTMHY
jgi:hypothetical protein